MTSGETHSRKLKIRNELGIHARPAALIVKTSNKYSAEIVFEKDGNTASGKSIIGLLTIEGNPGSEVVVTATGSDALEAVRALEELFEEKFFED